MVEGPWPNTSQKARVSFSVHNDRRSLCSDRRSFISTAGGLGRCRPPQADPGQSPDAGAEGKAPGSSENLAFYSTGKET